MRPRPSDDPVMNTCATPPPIVRNHPGYLRAEPDLSVTVNGIGAVAHHSTSGGVFTKRVSRRQPILGWQGQKLCAARIKERSGLDRERTDVLLHPSLESLFDFAITVGA